MAEGLVLDTSVLVNYWNEPALDSGRLIGIVKGGFGRLHPVCFAEVITGVKDKQDLVRTLGFLQTFKRLTVKPADLEVCVELMTLHRLSDGVEWPDCLIAATCLRLGLPVVTTNYKHFRPIPGLSVIREY